MGNQPASTPAYRRLDNYWRAVVDFVLPRLAATDRLVAPPDFAACFPGNPCHSPGDRLSGKYQWMILHKGLLREAGDRGIFALCLSLDPVFANEVFIVYAATNRFPRLGSGDVHYRSFLRVLEDQFVPSWLAAKGESFQGEQARTRPLVYMGDHCVLTRTVHGQAIYLDSRDLSVAPRLMLEGRWEEDTTDIFCSLLQPGATVLEVGANAGYYTLLAASKVGPRGKVIALEANPDLCRLLFKSIFINGFSDRCELVNKAATDRTGTATFHKLGQHLGGSSIAPFSAEQLAEWRDSFEEVTIETVSLDSLLQERGIDHVDVIRIDAEGSEPLIFKGLEKTLRQTGALAVIFEWNAASIVQMGHDPRAMLQDLLDRGFQLQRIGPNGLTPLHSPEETRDWRICDILMRKM